METQNRVDSFLGKFSQTDDYKAIAQALDSLERTDFTPEEQKSWYSARAYAARMSGSHDDSFRLLKEAMEAFPESEPLAYMLGSEYEYRGNTKKTLKYYGRTEIETAGAWGILHIARSFFLSGDFETAADKAESLLKSYAEEENLDDHWLYMHQLPFLSEIIFSWAAYLLALDDKARLEKGLFWAEETFGKEALASATALINASQSDDWRALAREQFKRLEGSETEREDGLEQLKALIWGVRADEAWETLPEKLLSWEEDESFWKSEAAYAITKWLLAETYAQSGRKKEEAEALKRAAEREPGLLEPALAFPYGLAPYLGSVVSRIELAPPERPPVYPPRYPYKEGAADEKEETWLEGLLAEGKRDISPLFGLSSLQDLLIGALSINLEPDVLVDEYEGIQAFAALHLLLLVLDKPFEVTTKTFSGISENLLAKPLEGDFKSLGQKTAVKLGENGSSLDLLLESRGEKTYGEWKAHLEAIREKLS